MSDGQKNKSKKIPTIFTMKQLNFVSILFFYVTQVSVKCNISNIMEKRKNYLVYSFIDTNVYLPSWKKAREGD